MKKNLKNDLDDSYHEYEGLLYDIESIYNNNDPFIDSNEIYKKIIYVPFLMMFAYLCDQIKPGIFVKVSIGSIMSFLVLTSIIKKWDKLKKIRSWNNFKQYLKNNN
jgi:hypothetical protein